MLMMVVMELYTGRRCDETRESEMLKCHKEMPQYMNNLTRNEAGIEDGKESQC